MGVWGETGAFMVRNDPHSGEILKNKPKGRRKYLGLGWLKPLLLFLERLQNGAGTGLAAQPQTDLSSHPAPGWLSQILSHLVSKSICSWLPLGPVSRVLSCPKLVIFSGKNFTTIPLITQTISLPKLYNHKKQWCYFMLHFLKGIAIFSDSKVLAIFILTCCRKSLVSGLKVLLLG